MLEMVSIDGCQVAVEQVGDHVKLVVFKNGGALMSLDDEWKPMSQLVKSLALATAAAQRVARGEKK